MRKLVLILLLVPVLAFAEPKPWMKKDGPDELFVNYSIAAACPFVAEQVQQIIDDVLMRSQIKPAEEEHHLNLVMEINCSKLSGEKFSTMLTADFYRVVEVDGAPYWARMGSSRHAGMAGAGGGDAIIKAIQGLLESVIADYLGANPDVGG